MRPFPTVALACAVWFSSIPVSHALEFVADQITRINGHSRHANIYYRDDMWRLELNDPGPVSVTIVRKDKDVMWLLLSRLKHFKSVPFDPEQTPKVSAQLEGEVAREEIGTEILDGHPVTLYEVTVQQGSREVGYYQWLATDIGFPLKLARKDGRWQVEYRRVKLHTLPNYLFELPMNYLPLEEFDRERLQTDQKPRM
ncbi:MAG: hypothetical protein AB1411_10050 [Nitrospirota bacterium]